MTIYQSTPDYYNDYISHGWAKNAAAKVHKYIERWRGKNGKWYYRYKSKAQEKTAKIMRDIKGFDPSDETKNVKRPFNRWMVGWDGESGNNRYRQRTSAEYVKIKPTKFKAKNIRDKGYSSSTGSGESKRVRNIATRHSNQSEKDEVARDNRLANAHRRTKNHKTANAIYNAWKKSAKKVTIYSERDGVKYGNRNHYDEAISLSNGRTRGYKNAASTNNKGYSGYTRALLNDKSKAGQMARLKSAAERSSKRNKTKKKKK